MRIEKRAASTTLPTTFFCELRTFFHAGFCVLIPKLSFIWTGHALFVAFVPDRIRCPSDIFALFTSSAHMCLPTLLYTLAGDWVPERLVLVDFFTRRTDEASFLRGKPIRTVVRIYLHWDCSTAVSLTAHVCKLCNHLNCHQMALRPGTLANTYSQPTNSLYASAACLWGTPCTSSYFRSRAAFRC